MRIKQNRVVVEICITIRVDIVPRSKLIYIFVFHAGENRLASLVSVPFSHPTIRDKFPIPPSSVPISPL